ncbi:hypothetical protein KCH_65250 [Kitasatospora cheerisanensis KCTC 2395]|uniref:Uncharacterized protein n=1 Tax=Kitasatospora cheerisanensis KCTC 2395 TaxID=1348663 RepID=A0A066YV61_9ACTN|nr:hypothetical protein KCH_65250 [Kitasatospora cheerisanensis KCTC 2395]
MGGRSHCRSSAARPAGAAGRTGAALRIDSNERRRRTG